MSTRPDRITRESTSQQAGRLSPALCLRGLSEQLDDAGMFGFGDRSVKSTEQAATDLTVVKSVCPLDCHDTCSMLVTVAGGRAVDLRGDPKHSFTRGFLCQKMARYLERVYSADRLMHPMKRVGQKGEGRFEPITWEQALGTIAERFAAI